MEDRRLLSVALFANSGLTTPGLAGSYVNQALQTYAAQDDWRTSQTISGTRVDAALNFTTGTWGARSSVHITGGSDANWENFSVQWDGYLQVPQTGTRIATASDDGSRMWIDANQNGVFESSEMLDNGWGGIHGATTGQRSAALTAGVYPIRIQYYEVSGDNVCMLSESPFIPTQFAAATGNPRQVVKVLVLNYDPQAPTLQNQRVHQVFGWTDPRRLASDFEGDVEWASGGAVDLQVVQWRDVQEFPAMLDNYRYTPEEYIANWQTQSGWHNSSTDFYRLAEEQGLAELINGHAIDEVWCFGPPGVDLFGETWMFGPNAFYVNGPVFSDIGIDRAVVGYGFNYERGPDTMIHNLGHRTEDSVKRPYGNTWNLANPTSAWDRFTANYWQSPAGTYGIGSCHVPANGDAHYDYADTRVVQSTANDWLNYPNLTGATSAVTLTNWAFGQYPDYGRDYLEWFFGLMPRAGGTTADGRQNNWYKYIYDFNAYEPTTGLPRNEDAFAGAATVKTAGAATCDFTVSYYDQTAINASTIDSGDVRVTGPGGYNVAAVPVGTGVERNTTAGTVRTVTYRITPPGGSWDLADVGTYTISMQSNQVRDTSNNAVPSGSIGSFRVAIPDPAVLDVNAIVAAGGAAITNTAFDIGTAAYVFDGNTATLARSSNTNPAYVQAAFTASRTIRGFNAYFSYAGGNPGYRWQVETADTQTDMDGKIGSYRLAVSPTDTVSDQFSRVTLTTPVTAKLFKLTATRLTGDNYVHINEWQLLGDATTESDPPIASAVPANVTAAGGNAKFIEVTYADAANVDMTSVATGNLLVSGPNGFSVAPYFYDASDFTNGASRTATYWFIPPGGYWDVADNGDYAVTLQANQVRDAFKNAAAQAVVLGVFQVNVPALVRRPLGDLAEFNAAQWTAWAQDATASVTDDTTKKTTGGASVRFDTTGGFDTYLRYPPPNTADWDLTYATNFHFDVYATNPSPYGFQQISPLIRLYDASGNYAEYQYYKNGSPYQLLNDARGVWKSHTVLLDASQTTTTGWRRYTTGNLQMNHIVSIEFHADTWDAGFTLWYDNLGFNLPSSYTCTWDGGGTDNKWSTAANWTGDMAPMAGDGLIFPAGAAQSNNVNDYPPSTRFASITVSGGSYDIQNNPIRSTTVVVQGNAALSATAIVCDAITIGTIAGDAENAVPENKPNHQVIPADRSFPPAVGVGNSTINNSSIDSPIIPAQSRVEQTGAEPVFPNQTASASFLDDALPMVPALMPGIGQAITTAETISIPRLSVRAKHQLIERSFLDLYSEELLAGTSNAEFNAVKSFDGHFFHSLHKRRLKDSLNEELADFLVRFSTH
ncbi:MAG: hypothetical protein IT426_08295 [Pirellulales bacterium]|nr:hypothetical protein [Pirellulales bacterium]